LLRVVKGGRRPDGPELGPTRPLPDPNRMQNLQGLHVCSNGWYEVRCVDRIHA
jgi:hypothetical protein